MTVDAKSKRGKFQVFGLYCMDVTMIIVMMKSDVNDVIIIIVVWHRLRIGQAPV